MKRTPVLIDVNGVPLRRASATTVAVQDLAGKWRSGCPSQSADAALLPALRLGNARADDLVRNNGIAANAVALHKDHIVGHMFLISYRPNWRWLGMRETAAKSLSMRWRRPGQNTQKGCLVRSTWKGTHVYGIYP